MIVIYVVLMLFTNRLVPMSYEEDINRIKHKRVIKGLPHELEVAIQTFIDQFIIMIKKKRRAFTVLHRKKILKNFQRKE